MGPTSRRLCRHRRGPRRAAQPGGPAGPPVRGSPALKLVSSQTFPIHSCFGPCIRSRLFFRCSERHPWGQRRVGWCTPRPCRLVSSTQGQPRPRVWRVKGGGDGLTCSQLLPFLQRRCRGQSARSPPAETEACAENLLESGSVLTDPWHGPEAPLRM